MKLKTSAILLAPAAFLLAALIACSSGSEADVGTPAPDSGEATPPRPAAEASPAATQVAIPTPAIEELRIIVAAGDLAVGPNRFIFGVIDSDSEPVRVPSARASFIRLDVEGAAWTPKTAVFRQWPQSKAGIYSTNVEFDGAGRWGVEVQVIEADGTLGLGRAAFQVKSKSASPGIGQPAPPSRNKTAVDVSDLSEISSASEPDPDLYQMTIEEAVSSGLPTLVSFATPAFCQTATCGPQLEVVSRIKDRFKGQANFIHVEVYDNPLEMKGDIRKGRLSPLMDEWGLATEPFAFILDEDGRVAFKFEGFATEGELAESLQRVLGP